MTTDAQILSNLLGGSKRKKATTPRNKAIKVGASVILSVDGNEYIIKARDTLYKNAWFIKGLETSFSRDMLTTGN